MARNSENTVRRALLPGLFALATLLGAGCQVLPAPQADPTHYYTLTEPRALEAAVPATPGSGLRVGLQKIDLEPYLRKGVLVVRKNGNEVVFNDYARWAEPLDTAMARLIQASLRSDPRIARVTLSPFPMSEPLDCTVSIHVKRADGEVRSSGASVRFVALIEVRAEGQEARTLVEKAFTAPETAWDGKDYDALARALSNDVLSLAGDIAASLPAKPATP